MGHVAKKKRADLVCDLSEALRVDLARVRRAAADDQLRRRLLRDPENLVEVDQVGLAVDSVAGDRVEPAGEVDLEAVGEMTTVVEPHGENRVSGLQRGEVDAHVRLRTRMRLHVCVLGAEELLRPVDRRLLDLVHDLAAAVVAPTGIPLRVLVRGDAPDRLEDARPSEVLRRDELDLTPLALELATDQLGDIGIDVRKRGLLQLLERLLGDRHRPRRLLARSEGGP
jgi:hypothetical protein